jgi:hypothetical protein
MSNGEGDPLDTRSQHPPQPSERALSKRLRKEATPPSTNQGTLIQLDNVDDKDNKNSIPLPNDNGLVEAEMIVSHE